MDRMSAITLQNGGKNDPKSTSAAVDQAENIRLLYRRGFSKAQIERHTQLQAVKTDDLRQNLEFMKLKEVTPDQILHKPEYLNLLTFDAVLVGKAWDIADQADTSFFTKEDMLDQAANIVLHLGPVKRLAPLRRTF